MAVSILKDGPEHTDKRTSSVNGSFNYQTLQPPSSSPLTRLHLVSSDILEDHVLITSSSLMELTSILSCSKGCVDFSASMGEVFLLLTQLLQLPEWFLLGLTPRGDQHQEWELKCITSLYFLQVKHNQCII